MGKNGQRGHSLGTLWPFTEVALAARAVGMGTCVMAVGSKRSGHEDAPETAVLCLPSGCGMLLTSWSPFLFL